MNRMILTINSGSSSLKAKLFSKNNNDQIDGFSFKNLNTRDKRKKAQQELIDKLLPYADSIDYAIHRIVMGGDGAENGEEVTVNVLKRLQDYAHLAPLHNPAAIDTILFLAKHLPQIPNYLAHDIAFYSDLPLAERTIPINKQIAKEFNIHKFGFHGISHQYAFEQMPYKYRRVISLHLGAGCSATAILDGKAIATSMSYTPQAGLVMQSRCGDIDPGVASFLTKKYGASRAKEIMESESGLAGLTDSDGEMLALLSVSGYPVEDESYVLDNRYLTMDADDARLAIDIYCHRIRDYIGAYGTRMSGVDALIFTGNIGFGSKFLRDKITFGLDYLCLKEVFVCKPDEEKAMALIAINRKRKEF